jgi:hypothetical protein
MASRRRTVTPPFLPNINWRYSEARLILLNDLERGILSVDEAEVTAEEAFFDVYREMVEFFQVPFQQFEAKLEDYRSQMQDTLKNSADELVALMRDRRIHPRQTHNLRGEPVFDMSPARNLLKADILDKVHTRMTPSEIQSSRPEYWPFKPRKFKERIYQEIRLVKFIFYLELKRDQERKKLANKLGKPYVGAINQWIT